MRTKPKKQEVFSESNRAALTLYQSAEHYLKEHLGEDKVLKPKAWKAWSCRPYPKKSRLYSDLQTLKAEVQEAEAVKKCVEQAVQPEQNREKTQSKRRDMELWLHRRNGIMAVLKGNKKLEVKEWVKWK